MRCHSPAISRHHCEIRVAGVDITIVDLNSRNGVRVNGEFIKEERRLKTGDCLAIGRLEFELIVDAPKARSGFDPLGDSVCELLLEGDRREAEDRPTDSRWYKIEPVDPFAGMSEKEKLQAKAREKIPRQKQPQKLPSRVAASTTVAINQVLAKYGQNAERCYRRRPPSGTPSDTVSWSTEDCDSPVVADS